jgi:hypothetical protein
MNECRLSQIEAYGALSEYLNSEKFMRPHRVLGVTIHEGGDFILQVEEITRKPRKSRAKHRALSLAEMQDMDHPIDAKLNDDASH